MEIKKLYIDGEWVTGSEGKTFQSTNPATGEVLAEIAEEHPEIKVCKVNVDEEPELASAFQVSSIPMVVAIKDGKVVNTSVGFRPKEQILGML